MRVRACVRLTPVSLSRFPRDSGHRQAAAAAPCRGVVLPHSGCWTRAVSRCALAPPPPRLSLASFASGTASMATASGLRCASAPPTSASLLVLVPHAPRTHRPFPSCNSPPSSPNMEVLARLHDHANGSTTATSSLTSCGTSSTHSCTRSFSALRRVTYSLALP